ncbi:hypothetical protein A2V56_00595 [Candidatus Woesebacteria bacterium RBG_19FT_COMBO_42_9]|nr:MAG: hypothetical protein A2V56_00595 [Candidatus Woesebacteria bacterium RBG_19FT_COMBO_42_9]
MGNPISKNLKKGTIGELFVQLRLLEFGVQSAPPIKDSGNDLIAIRGETTKFIQVKTEHRLRNLPVVYHLVAIVDLKYDKNGIYLDKSAIWIVKKGEQLREKRRLDQKLVNEIWN